MKLLVVEDEKELLDSISNFFSDEGYICETTENFKGAIEKLSDYNYDCVIVDINLPDGSGFDIVSYIRKNKKGVGIIIISARDTVDDRVKGLTLGADDYLVKPFNLVELNVRIKALYRRINFRGSTTILVGDIEINPEEFKVYIKNTLVDFTKKEFDLLMFLVANQNRVITKESIAEHLWGDYIDNADSFDFVYSHIKNLRKKLNKHGGVGEYLQNIYNVGYKFNAP